VEHFQGCVPNKSFVPLPPSSEVHFAAQDKKSNVPFAAVIALPPVGFGNNDYSNRDKEGDHSPVCDAFSMRGWSPVATEANVGSLVPYHIGCRKPSDQFLIKPMR